LVRDGYNGYLLPVGDYRGMAAAAVNLLADRARYREFSGNARRRAVEEFSREKGVDQYEQFYREIRASPPGGRQALAGTLAGRG
jgi:glycosyltransferase involved in cell wall biosynthesis